MKVCDNWDKEQRMVLDIVENYVAQVNIARESTKTRRAVVETPSIIVTGGAGSGKSEVIKVVAQRVDRSLRRSGDDPDKPYVLLCAPTGTAAANINGMTLHSAFNIGFGNTFIPATINPEM